MKTALITGGAGFIGSHLCERLLADGYRVICVDNLFTSSRENIKHLESNGNFLFIEHDIVNPLNLDDKIDEIYNLACPASPVHYQRDAIFTVKTNIIGAINILDLARTKGAVVFQSSTSEVYGDPSVHPQVESYRGNVNPIGPRACYDEGKRCAETLFFDYNRMYNVPIKVVRIFNTFGPRMDSNDGRVVSNFIVQALKNEDITIYGDGTQTRSFCYVDDLINGFVKMMASDRSVIGPVNLGNPQEITVKTMAEAIIEMTGSKSKIVYQDLPTDDPTRRCPDITLAKTKLGWQPQVDWKVGIEKTIKYFQTIIR